MEEQRLELLAPAGSYEGMQAAFGAGADAVYVGGRQFGARAYAQNFEEEELLRAIDEAHLHGKALYLTVNTLMKERELTEELYGYLKPLYEQGLDAVIVQDLGALAFIRRNFPDLPVHASTQMSIAGPEGAELLKSLGVTRVVTARELSLREIREIYDRTGMEIESFVHGALCYCYSGQCLFSSLIGGRSGNRGRCAQPCRLPYKAGDGKRKGAGEERYVLSPKDICTLPLIPKIAASGVYSLKIEGRMKRPEYTAGVTGIYRRYVDLYLEKGAQGYSVDPEDIRRLEQLYSRGSFSQGYYEQHNGRRMITLTKPSYNDKNRKLLEEIRKNSDAAVFSKEKIKGNLILSAGSYAKLELKSGSLCVTVDGDMVQEAVKQPITEEKIKKQLLKTGGTAFEFQELDITMGDRIFLPVQSLNKLRREGLEKLACEKTASFRRSAAAVKAGKEEPARSLRKGDKPLLHLYIEEADFLEKLSGIRGVDAFYIDSHAAGVPESVDRLKRTAADLHAGGRKCYLAMPRIFRDQTARLYGTIREPLFESGIDGVLVRNPEELYFLLAGGFRGEIITDSSLYTMNREAAGLMRSLGAVRSTAPLELNAGELRQRGMEGSEMVVYGYLPVMVSAQCIKKTMGDCRRRSGRIFLKDRMNKEFCVKNVCEECYNVIYNTSPLSLLGMEKEILSMGPEALRLDFTIESPEEAVRITEDFIAGFYRHETGIVPEGDFTRGHFKRGIE